MSKPNGTNKAGGSTPPAPLSKDDLPLWRIIMAGDPISPQEIRAKTREDAWDKYKAMGGKRVSVDPMGKMTLPTIEEMK